VWSSGVSRIAVQSWTKLAGHGALPHRAASKSMQYLLPSAVFLLMLSVGMSLEPTKVVANWRRLTWFTWLCLTIATFLIPPALALLLAHIFGLTLGATAGLFMVGATPGAPLLTRNMARRGFDMHMAASYQLWAALMVPVMIPLVVAAAGKIYGRDGAAAALGLKPTTLYGKMRKHHIARPPASK